MNTTLTQREPAAGVAAILRIAATVVIVAANAFCSTAFGFKVWYVGNAIHETITTNAFLPIQRTLSNGQPIGFNPLVTDSIAADNRDIDRDHFWDPVFHFDNENFAASSNRLFNTRNEIVRLTRKGRFLAAQQLLGQSLHTLQDFYAHSTWVENGERLPSQDLGRRTLTNAPEPLSTNYPLLYTCDSRGRVPAILQQYLLTSGYFYLAQVNPLTGGSPTAWTNDPIFHSIFNNESSWPLNRCIHGNDTGPGINKDQPGRGPDHQVAVNVAISATAQYVNDILDDIVKGQTAAASDVAICGLMGQEQSAACTGIHTFTVLPTLGGTHSYAAGLNNAGQVAGVASLGSGFQRATLWTASSIKNLDSNLADPIPDAFGRWPYGFFGSNAVAVNGIGQAVGTELDGSFTSCCARRPVLWSGSNRVFLPVLGSIFSDAYATGINDAGQIIGLDQSVGRDHAVLWNGTSAPIDLGSNAALNGINSHGQIAGTIFRSSGVARATVWNGTVPFDLGTLDGVSSSSSQALAINDVGQVVGVSNALGQPEHVVLWTLGATTPPVDLGATGRPMSINKGGKIVGFNGRRAILWIAGSSVTDLNSYLDTNTRNAGWVLLEAHSINDNGLISGIAFNNLTGANRGFLLRPSGI